METNEQQKKRFYLKWPWNLMVYLLLVVFLRVFAILPILIIMWWNKKQQSNGPEEGYCLQRTRGRLIQLVWAAMALLVSAAGAAWLVTNWSQDRTGWDLTNYAKIAVGGVLAAGGLLTAVYEAYTGLRDAPVPGKERTGQLHPRPASLPRRGSPGGGTVCHGGPGYQRKRPVVRQAGCR